MATTAQTVVPGGPKAPFPPFQPDTFVSQLFWLTITFAILYVMASRLVLPRLGGIIAARSQQIENDVADAQRLKAEADAANAVYETSLTDARTRAQALAHAAREEQAAAGERVRKTLEEQLNGRLAEAEKTIAATKTAAMSNVVAIATDAASAIVKRLIGTEPSSQVVTAAVSNVLKR
jgi:F-type H+-transporting ATPase subunit b